MRNFIAEYVAAVRARQAMAAAPMITVPAYTPEQLSRLSAALEAHRPQIVMANWHYNEPRPTLPVARSCTFDPTARLSPLAGHLLYVGAMTEGRAA